MPAADSPTPDAARGGALELRGVGDGLLDEPFALRVRGAGPDARLVWRARYRDDDGRIWRAAGLRCEDLASDWSPAKDGTGDVAALRSLRAVSIDLRVEAPDGRGAARTVTRAIAADGVRIRRWRDGLAATLHVPAGRPCATVLVDATAGSAQAAVAALAAPLLASRGALVLVVPAARGRDAPADPVADARERLAAVPGAAAQIVVLAALDPLGNDGPRPSPDGVVLPPNVGLREPAHAAAARAVAWDALLARLGASPRAAVAPP